MRSLLAVLAVCAAVLLPAHALAHSELVSAPFKANEQRVFYHGFTKVFLQLCYIGDNNPATNTTANVTVFEGVVSGANNVTLTVMEGECGVTSGGFLKLQPSPGGGTYTIYPVP